jgi:hypothetical protein
MMMWTTEAQECVSTSKTADAGRARMWRCWTVENEGRQQAADTATDTVMGQERSLTTRGAHMSGLMACCAVSRRGTRVVHVYHNSEIAAEPPRCAAGCRHEATPLRVLATPALPGWTVEARSRWQRAGGMSGRRRRGGRAAGGGAF